ncbi:1-acyl-sn-glycerol-3-phosphate acyltransferase-like protein, partial [Trifolium medium]|nr:1-acyl-sn-glycerol-3-phosphate acyltransferase-like protein [Trifolium medium]
MQLVHNSISTVGLIHLTTEIVLDKATMVKVQVKRHKMDELPETADGIAQWCKDTFIAKDALLEKYNTTDRFSELELQEIRRPKSSIMVVLSWSCLLGFLLYKFFKWSSLLSTWQGILFTVLFL